MSIKTRTCCDALTVHAQCHRPASDPYTHTNQTSLFGALVHSRASSSSTSLSTRLELPPLSEQQHFNGIRVPKLADVRTTDPVFTSYGLIASNNELKKI